MIPSVLVALIVLLSGGLIAYRKGDFFSRGVAVTLFTGVFGLIALGASKRSKAKEGHLIDYHYWPQYSFEALCGNILFIITLVLISRLSTKTQLENIMGDAIAVFLVILFIGFIIFLILREIMCWYWKINQILTVLESIDSKLSANRLSASSQGSANTSLPSGTELCPFCKEPTSKADDICQNCGKRKR
jgi:hypothetical protein